MHARTRSKPARSRPIRITPEVNRHYLETVALHAPETFAILGGFLDDPYLVTDFRFCPPRRTASGEFDASGEHINLDHDFMNFVVDKEWKPAGKYLVGIWHSHPSGVIRPSRGDPASNTGDIVFFTSCLNNDDSPDRSWRYFLAPITTFGADGSDQIHGWVLDRGSTTPRPCHVIIDPFANAGIEDYRHMQRPTVLLPHLISCPLSSSDDNCTDSF
ncbi:MAG: Mov34/MPN/PAD-1 family protein [Phycisphaerales bacterium]|nr:Mov34/MPN/PAD-1 family protein [Phycisphaerales bacterium]